VVREVSDMVGQTPGASHSVAFAGLDATTSTEASNDATVFAKLAPFEERASKGADCPKDSRRSAGPAVHSGKRRCSGDCATTGAGHR
jgi:hypothetical protein